MSWRDQDYDAVRHAQWEQEQSRPYDWQDVVVISGATACAVFFLLILIFGA